MQKPKKVSTSQSYMNTDDMKHILVRQSSFSLIIDLYDVGSPLAEMEINRQVSVCRWPVGRARALYG